MVEPYTGQSTPHVADVPPGMTMRGHVSGHPAIAHLLQGKLPTLAVQLKDAARLLGS